MDIVARKEGRGATQLHVGRNFHVTRFLYYDKPPVLAEEEPFITAISFNATKRCVQLPRGILLRHHAGLRR